MEITMQVTIGEVIYGALLACALCTVIAIKYEKFFTKIARAQKN